MYLPCELHKVTFVGIGEGFVGLKVIFDSVTDVVTICWEFVCSVVFVGEVVVDVVGIDVTVFLIKKFV